MRTRILVTVALALALAWPAGSAVAAPGNEPAPPDTKRERHASDVVDPQRALAPCDPGGPTGRDANLAAQLNTTLGAKMRGYMNAYRVSCARMVVKAVHDRGLDPHAATIAITTTIVESSIDNIAQEIDHDSLGLFQQRASWGTRAQRLDPTWSTNAFLTKMLQKFPNNGWMSAAVGHVCQTVQVSAYPARYQPQAGDGQIIAQALWPVPIEQRTRFADIDGDGRDEIVSILGSGEVWAYRNRGWDAGDIYVGGDSKLIARGFTNPTTTFFADINGDGRDEILSVVGANGDVWAYRNRGNWAGGDLYAGNDSKLVAQGFTGERTVFGDLTGDGRDEIMTVHHNGDVIAYRNRGNWAGGDLYAGHDRKLVAQGFTDPVRTKFGDLTGDGFEEIITVLGSGDVYAYRNLGQWENGETFSGGQNRRVAQGFTDGTRTKFGDLTGDGRAEIVTVLGSGHVWAYRNRGNWEGGDLYQGTDSRKVAEGFGP